MRASEGERDWLYGMNARKSSSVLAFIDISDRKVREVSMNGGFSRSD